jgi:recombination protein RecA
MSDGVDNIIKGLRDSDFQVHLLSEEPSCVVKRWISTGCTPLDAIIGKGLPVGRFTEVYGGASSGKSLIAGQVAASAQADGHTVLYIDTEGAVSIEILEKLGVNTETLLYIMPDTIEEVFAIFENAINAFKKGKKKGDDSVLVLIWDSIAATTALAELEHEVGKAHMAVHARLMSQGLRKMTKLFQGDVCAMFINQTRQKLGVMFGNKESTFGGKAMEFYSSVRVRLGNPKKIDGEKDVIGVTTKATVVKNKVSPPFRSAVLPIYFDIGIDDAEAMWLFFKDYGFLKHTNKGWYTFEEILGDKKVQEAGWLDVYNEHYDKLEELAFSL